MPTLIKMPKLSDTMTEGTLLSWKISKGDSVEMGEIIAEVETDKATMEMEAFDEGTVHELYVEEGAKVAVGAKMALLLGDGESPEDVSGGEGGSEEKTGQEASEGGKDKGASNKVDEQEPLPGEGEDKQDKPPAEVAGREKSKRGGGKTDAAKPAKPAPPDRRVKSSPLARKLAEEKGVDINTLDGSGPGGRVIARDVEAASATPTASTTAGPAGGGAGLPAPVLPKVGEDDEVIELTTMRRIIADRLVISKLQQPHFYLRLELDAGPLMDLRREINDSEGKREGGNKYTINDFILKAVVSAMQAVPAMNASWNGDSIVRFARIGLAVAISVDDGLVTPVIKDAGEKSLLDISKAVKDLAARAATKKLKPDEFDGGTITVSNLGAWGIDHFDAIINPPQSSILSVGAIKEKPVVKDGAIVPGKRMWLGLSCDHRVVDGALGATFLAEVCKRIEQPALMLV